MKSLGIENTRFRCTKIRTEYLMDKSQRIAAELNYSKSSLQRTDGGGAWYRSRCPL
jgi:hypothetical protein